MPHLTWKEINEKKHYLESELSATSIQIKHFENTIQLLKKRLSFVQDRISWWNKVILSHEEEDT